MEKYTNLAGKRISKVFKCSSVRDDVINLSKAINKAVGKWPRNCGAILWREDFAPSDYARPDNLLVVYHGRANMNENLLGTLLDISNRYTGTLTYASLENFLFSTIHKTSPINRVLNCPNVVVNWPFFAPNKYVLAQYIDIYKFKCKWGWTRLYTNPYPTKDERKLLDDFNSDFKIKSYENIDLAISEINSREGVSFDLSTKADSDKFGKKNQFAKTALPLYFIKKLSDNTELSMLTPDMLYLTHDKHAELAMGIYSMSDPYSLLKTIPR